MLSAFFSTVAFIAAETALGAGAAHVASPAVAPVRIAAAEASASKGVKKTVTLAAAVPAPEPPKAFSDLSDEAVAAEVLGHLENLTTLAGDFVQTAPSGAVVTGKVYLRRPGQIRFDYDDPSPITVVATGGVVYVENAELETTDSYPLKKTPLRFLLSKKIDIGDATLKSVERGSDSIAVTYAAADDENGQESGGEITLVLSAPALSIEKWAVKDPQGGVTVVALHGVTAGGAIENRLFRAPDAGGAFIKD